MKMALSPLQLREGWLIAGILALIALFFAIDARVELGVQVGVCYSTVMLLVFYSTRQELAWTVAVICSLLVLLGIYVSPPGGELWKVVSNRILSVLVIWVAAAMCWLRQVDARKAASLNQSLDNRRQQVEQALYELQEQREKQERKSFELQCVLVDLKAERARLGREIDMRKVAELALMQARDDLELRVQERTIELQREIHDRKRAEAALSERARALDEANRLLRENARELEQFNRLMIGREERIIELKQQINALAEACGRRPPYDLSFAN